MSEPGARTPSGTVVDDAPSREVEPEADVEALIAEYDEERPERQLPRWLWIGVAAVCAMISAAILIEVFVPDPRGSQHFRMAFLTAVLPLTLLAYRGCATAGRGAATPRASSTGRWRWRPW